MIGAATAIRWDDAWGIVLAAGAGAAGAVVCGIAALPLIGAHAAGALAIAVAPALALVVMRAAVSRAAAAFAVLDGLLAHGSDHALRLDTAGTIVADCDMRLATIGDPPQRLTGCALVDLFDPSAQAEVADRIAAAVAGRCAALDCAPMAFGLLPLRWANLRLVPIPARGGGGVLALLRDVSAAVELAAACDTALLIDPLTGLGNRQAFLQALENCCAGAETGCIVLLAIDHLAAINHRHGSIAGDTVLCALAREALAHVRIGDAVMRIGGQHFGVILPAADPRGASQVAARIVAAFGGSARAVGDCIVRATVSAGVAPWHATAAETLRHAERALLAAQARGRDRVEVAAMVRQVEAPRW